MKKNLVILIGVLLFISFAGAVIFLPRTSSDNSDLQVVSTGVVHEVILTDEGFNPKEITIKKGDTVRFRSNLSDPYWPASDLHPTHGIYPEFDPLNPIEPNKSWDFTPAKVGPWKYHDHLHPIYRGVIVVQ